MRLLIALFSAFTLLQFALLPMAVLAERVFVDAAGRSVSIPDRAGRVLAAGPPASVLLYVLAADKMVGWVRSPRAVSRRQTFHQD